MVRILIADHNRNLGYVLGRELEDEGYTVDLAADGVEAVLRVLDGSDYDFVFIDAFTPRLDGLNALRIIKKINPDIRVITFAAADLSGEMQSVLDAGASACLAKPYEMEAIKTYLRSQIAERRDG